LSDKIVNRDIILNLIEKSPEILNQLMAPAKNIEGIKILQVDGLRQDGTATQTPTLGLINTILSAGAALPVLKEFLEFSKIDKSIINKISEYIPGLKTGSSQGGVGEK
jgi:uncharacterized membrane protein YqiK